MKTTITALLLTNILIPFMVAVAGTNNGPEDNSGSIRPYPNNPMYWEYKGEPVLLLGGSSNDNIFQQALAGLDEELDKLASHGGNYIRCTMSSRDPGDAFPFYRDEETGLFDLDKWNDEYWKKFDHFLKATQQRDIIVQIEIWATYDFYSRGSHILDGKTAWERNPFNPGNNSNYEEAGSGLFYLFRSTGQEIINPFFNTTLPLPEPFDFSTKPVVLAYQQKFVDKLLSISLNYDHILYCIDNETQADPKWSRYWAQYIRGKAGEQNRRVEITEMFDPFDPTGGAVEGAGMQSISTHFFTLRSNVWVTLNDPENYSFIEISNHNFQRGQVHYETANYIWKKVQESGTLRPINNTKIYGAGGEDWAGSAKEAQERFWRNIFAGTASARFHRPPYGLGNNDTALSHIKSMRIFTNEMDFFQHKPSNQILADREENEAYCLAADEKEFVVYFPANGEVTLNAPRGKYDVKWLDISASQWKETTAIELPGLLNTPSDGMWAVILRKR
jgi:hypothetical protein